MTVFKEDEIVQVERRWKPGGFLLQLTCALMHEPLSLLRFWLLLLSSAFQADAEIRFTAPSQTGVCSPGRPGRGGREQRGQELVERLLLNTRDGWRMRNICPRQVQPLGWAPKPPVQRSCTAPLWHGAGTAPTGGGGGETCLVLLKIFLWGNEGGKATPSVLANFLLSVSYYYLA